MREMFKEKNHLGNIICRSKLFLKRRALRTLKSSIHFRNKV